jgi:hypothetical protein
MISHRFSPVRMADQIVANQPWQTVKPGPA